MYVETVLAKKGSDVLTISPDAMVFEAIVAMEENNVGALLVMDESKIVGIITERDYARKVIIKGKFSKETPVGEVMTKKVCFIDKKKKLDECMAVMTEKRVRHLPVLENKELIGLISIGDVVKKSLKSKNTILIICSTTSMVSIRAFSKTNMLVKRKSSHAANASVSNVRHNSCWRFMT